MASINGISVKGITKFKGHEGEPLAQGNLYVNNKKIGFWSQDSHGGPDCYVLDPKYDERLLNQAVISRNQDKAMHGTSRGGETYTIDYDMDLLLSDLLCLREDEKEFVKAENRKIFQENPQNLLQFSPKCGIISYDDRKYWRVGKQVHSLVYVSREVR